jgi:hypothetical protein
MTVARPNQLFLKGQTFFKQLQLEFVVVVTGGKTAELDCHGVPLACLFGVVQFCHRPTAHRF